MVLRLFMLVLLSTSAAIAMAEPLTLVRVSDDGKHFVRGNPAVPWRVWGVNYDHDASGRLLDEYWIDEWATVIEDFNEMNF